MTVGDDRSSLSLTVPDSWIDLSPEITARQLATGWALTYFWRRTERTGRARWHQTVF
ncbi:MAG: hypothetical protein R3C44_24300 [Chloroflexota bacterium]